jgi:hypothetical protein
LWCVSLFDMLRRHHSANLLAAFFVRQSNYIL